MSKSQEKQWRLKISVYQRSLAVSLLVFWLWPEAAMGNLWFLLEVDERLQNI